MEEDNKKHRNIKKRVKIMENWIEMMNEQMSSEMWQLELLCRKAIESFPFVVLCAVPILFCIVWFLVALDRKSVQHRDIPQSLDQHKMMERYNTSSGNRFSQPATRLLQKQNNAAA